MWCCTDLYHNFAHAHQYKKSKQNKILAHFKISIPSNPTRFISRYHEDQNESYFPPKSLKNPQSPLILVVELIGLFGMHKVLGSNPAICSWKIQAVELEKIWQPCLIRGDSARIGGKMCDTANWLLHIVLSMESISLN